MDINKIDKIDTNLVVPSIQENLIETERDKWGNILNEQTFKTLNNNMKIMKEILLEIVNESNITSLENIKLRLKNLETDRDNIETIINDNVTDRISIGKDDRKLNLVSNGGLLLNGEKITLNNEINSKSDKYVNDIVADKLEIGKSDRELNLITKNNLRINGSELDLSSLGSGEAPISPKKDIISEFGKVQVNVISTSPMEITFNKTYTNPPLVIFSGFSPSTSLRYFYGVNITNTGFTVKCNAFDNNMFITYIVISQD